MADCIFCKIIEGTIPSEKVYEDDDVVAFLDIHPVRKGHTLVVPRQHSEDFAGTDPAVLSRAIVSVQKVAAKVTAGVGAEGFVMAALNGPAAGQEVFHLHFHVIPRSTGDGAGVTFGPHEAYGEGEMAEVARRIRGA